VGERSCARLLCGYGRACNLSPGLESLRHLLTVGGGRAEVTPGPEVRRRKAIRGEEALGVPGRLEPLHPSFPLASGLVGVFCPVIQIAMLSMLYPRQDLPVGSPTARQFIRDNHPWHVCEPREQLAEKFLRGSLVTAPLHDNI
jgi:hypothetical protein